MFDRSDKEVWFFTIISHHHLNWYNCWYCRHNGSPMWRDWQPYAIWGRDPVHS